MPIKQSGACPITSEKEAETGLNYYYQWTSVGGGLTGENNTTCFGFVSTTIKFLGRVSCFRSNHHPRIKFTVHLFECFYYPF